MDNYTEISKIKNIKEFLFGGNSTITIKSGKSGKHFTFKVKVANKKDINSPYFVSVLNGTDNYTNYAYLGLITNNKNFKLTSKSKVGNESISYKAFNFFFNDLINGKIHSDLTIYHSGKCARCGRKLTTPESIKNGFGPECMKKVSKKD